MTNFKKFWDTQKKSFFGMRKIILFVVVGLVLILSVLAHKDAAVSSDTTSEYRINTGFTPIHAAVGQEQSMFVDIQNKDDLTQKQGLSVEFNVYKDAISIADVIPANLESEILAIENEPGIYSGTYTFTESGNFLITVNIYEDGDLISKSSKNMSVEPNSPSPVFWYYMLAIIIIGGFLARININ